MMFPTRKEAKTFASSKFYQRIPISLSLPEGSLTPVQVMKRLKHVSKHCYLLESMEESKLGGQYTFLGYHPTIELSTLNGQTTIVEDDQITIRKEPASTILREILNTHKSPKIQGLPPFTGGLVGYFSYDYIKYVEPTLHLQEENHEELKDMDVMVFEKVIAFDHQKHSITLITNMACDSFDVNYTKAEEELHAMSKLILFGKEQEEDGGMTGPLQLLFDKEKYCEMVKEAKRYIRNGDIFQVVLSNRFEARYEGSLLNTYCSLKQRNPSPYMFYFTSPTLELAGASPETLVKRKGDSVYTFPLAGTRPRGVTKEADLQLEEELLADEKECAEHNMLVDLGRNDLGKVSVFGSVEVEKYMGVQRFSHVMHIGSSIRGTLRDGVDALEVIEAILPAGTLSGAPKLRACQIIDQLEKKKRGIYGGAIGYLDFSGEMDTCIAIRFVYKKDGKIYIRSGAGIVYDSVPEKEFEECLNKAKGVLVAIRMAEGGEDNDRTHR